MGAVRRVSVLGAPGVRAIELCVGCRCRVVQVGGPANRNSPSDMLK